jgi:hypothetical protein
LIQINHPYKKIQKTTGEKITESLKYAEYNSFLKISTIKNEKAILEKYIRINVKNL